MPFQQTSDERKRILLTIIMRASAARFLEAFPFWDAQLLAYCGFFGQGWTNEKQRVDAEALVSRLSVAIQARDM